MDYPKEKTRRIMARVALRRLSALANAVREEERQDAIAARRAAFWIGAGLFILCLSPAIYWSIFEAHVKIRLFASSLVIGLACGIALVAWEKWRRFADKTKGAPKISQPGSHEKQ